MKHYDVLKKKTKRKVHKCFLSFLALMVTFGLFDFSYINEIHGATANLTFSTSVIDGIGQDGETLTEVQSGQSFFLQIGYMYSVAGDGYSYGPGLLQIIKPEFAELDVKATEQLMRDYNSVFTKIVQNGNQILFSTDEGVTIPAATAGTLYAKFKYKNFETPNNYGENGEVERFNQIQYSGFLKSSTGTTVPMDNILIPDIKVVSKAAEVWETTKKTNDYSEQGDFYVVPYQISAKPDNGDRYGRLNMDPFTFVDDLPTGSTGVVDSATKKQIGYPAKGGVDHIVSITRDPGQIGSEKELTNEDYTLTKNEDGSIKSIQFSQSAFNKSNKATNIDDGHLMGTSFEVKVAYPKAAYEIMNNETTFDSYHLENNVRLDYTPLGETVQSHASKSTVDLGWKETDPKTYNIVVQKQVSVKTNDLIGVPVINDLTKPLQDHYYKDSNKRIGFTLYTDKECTKIATNWDGSSIAGKGQNINDKGQVEFTELLAGTYYLKETSTIDGFDKVANKKVVIAKDGAIRVDETTLATDETIKVVNITNESGFGYVAFWKKGSSAASGDAGTYLEGVDFTLTQNGPDGKKTYKASSNRDGLVLFTGIPAGNYTLTEDKGADDEFLPIEGTYSVTVVGNRVNYPLHNNGKLDKDDDSKPYILNQSKKGSLKILKKDSKTDESLTGSQFDAYGPYDTEAEALAASDGDPKQRIGDEYTDGKAYFALLPGFYSVVETKAPTGYTKSDESYIVKINLNTTLELTVKNEPQGSLIIEKQGQLQLGANPNNYPLVGLMGAEFTLYTDALCTKEAKDVNGDIAKITKFGISGNVASSKEHPLFLDNGTYYIKETKVPNNYVGMETTMVEIEAGEIFTFKAINTTESLGSIQILKKDARTGNPLQGAEFEVKGLDESNKNVTVTGKSGDDGLVTFHFLPSGNYQIKEISVPAGYVDPSLYTQQVEVKKNTLIEITVENEPLVTYQLQKVDSIHETITITVGVKFNLYKSEDDAKRNVNPIQTQNAKVNGLITFTNLVPNETYFYREIATNSNYTLSDAIGRFKAPGKDEGYIQTNPIKVKNEHNGTLEIIKKANVLGTDESTFVSRITIRIYPKLSDNFDNDKKVNTASKKFFTRSTDDNGIAKVANLSVGSYWVEEFDLGEHTEFTKFEPFAVEVIAGSGYTLNNIPIPAVSKEVMNDYAKGKVQIKKVDNNGDFVNAVFSIYAKGDTELKKPLGTIETSLTNGVGVSTYLNPGDYVLVETRATDNGEYQYIVDKTPMPFTIEAGKLATLKDNAPIKNTLSGNILIKKYEAWNSDDGNVKFPLAGITFNVYEQLEDGTKKFFGATESTIEGVVVKGLVPGKTYVIEEVLAADSVYEKAKPQTITAVSGKTITVSFDNIPNKGKLKIVKTNLAGDIRLDKAKFDIYKEVEEADKPNQVLTIDNEKVYVQLVQEGVVTGTALNPDGSVDTGVAYSQFLEDGTKVFLKETKAPEGYDKIQTWSGPYEIKAGTLTIATIKNTLLGDPIGGNKFDHLGNGIAGADVGLFRSEEQAKKVNNILAGNDTSISIEDMFELLENEDSDRMGLVDRATSDKDGKLTFKHIENGTTYYTVELRAPKNYIRSNKVYKAIAENDEIKFDGNDLVNERLGQFKLKKTATLSGQTVLLDDVKFNVYKAIEEYEYNPDVKITKDMFYDTVVATPVTGTLTGVKGNGSFLSEHLEAGWYIFQENQDPSEQPTHLEISSTYYAVKIENDKINEVHVNTPIENILKYGKFVLTKVNKKDPSTKVNANFKLEVKDKDGFYSVVSGYNNFEVSKDKVYESGYLPIGSYKLTEVSVETGFTVDKTPIFFTVEAGKVTGMRNDVIEIIDGVYTDFPIVVKNDPQGSINLTKKGNILSTDSETPLEGVTFTLYKKTSDSAQEDIKQTAVATTVTNAEGLISIKNLDASAYWLVETEHSEENVANGYVVKGVYSLDVKPGETCKTYKNEDGTSDSTGVIMNHSTFGKLQIEKVDAYDANTKLSGAVFEVYSDKELKNKVDTITTDANGIATTTLLPVGDYYMKETVAPVGYFVSDTIYGPYMVEKQTIIKGIAAIENNLKQRVEIVKKNKKDQSIITDLTNAKFAIYGEEACETLIQTITPKDGKLIFTDLQPNTKYWIKELKAPNGFITSSESHPVETNSTGVDNVAEVDIFNEPYGSITIEKMGQWMFDETLDKAIALAGAEFTLYDKDKKEQAKQTSDASGRIRFEHLEAGTYYVKETKVPDGFSMPTQNAEFKEVIVEMGVENKVFTGDNAFVNLPNMSKFVFKKTAYDEVTPLTSAKFKLQVKLNNVYEDVDGYTSITLDESASYESGLLESGDYKLIEIVTPLHFTTMKPITFTLEKAKISTITTMDKQTIVNEAKGNIEFMKYSDSGVYDSSTNSNLPLAGVTFTLNKVGDTTFAKEAVSDANGKVTWLDIDAGEYTIKETTTLPGYDLDKQIYTVSVEAGKSTVETYYPNVRDIINVSNSGRILIYKKDNNGAALKGAKFSIYKMTNGNIVGEPLETIESGLDGYAISKLLPADKTGTTYRVKEIQAPLGYTLDETYGLLQQDVVVMPLQDVGIIKSNAQHGNANNYLEFVNTKYDDAKKNNVKISKGIVENGTTILQTNATDSLLEQPYRATYSLYGFADANSNRLPVKDVIVTDTEMKYVYYENNNVNDKKEEVITDDAYTIDSVKVNQATMDGGGAIFATLQYQKVNDSGTTWNNFTNNKVDVSNGSHNFDISKLNAKRFRVMYQGGNGALISKNFQTVGIDFSVTYAKRKSDATKHEIREITNKADVTYGYYLKDHMGDDVYETVCVQSNETLIKFPRINDKTPIVSIGINVDNHDQNAKPFLPGSSVFYTITVKNESSDQTLLFEKPIVSFDLPADMSLNDFYQNYASQFLVLRGFDPSSLDTVSLDDIDIVISDTNAKVLNNGVVEEMVPVQKTKKVTMTFNSVKLGSAESLFIKFGGTLSQKNPAFPSAARSTKKASNIGLIAPVYLNSAKEILLSAENPYGNSFLPVSQGTLVADKDLDLIVGKDQPGNGEKYVFNHAVIEVAAINNLNIYKQVKGQYNTAFMGTGNIASTAPSGLIDYKIMMSDGKSDEKISKVRILDVLPFKVDSGQVDVNGNPIYLQDTFVNRSNQQAVVTDRTTTLTKRATYDGGLIVTDHNGKKIDESKYTVYYCVSDGTNDIDIVDEWTKDKREAFAPTAELPMLYGTMDDRAWSLSNAHKWQTNMPSDKRQITAIGVEVDYGTAGMEAGGSITVNFKMKAPSYSTSELHDVQNGLLVNSAMGAVSRQQHGAVITDEDRIENDPVKVRLTLPKGSIGDYAFYDLDKDGIQDALEPPIADLSVKLHVTKKTQGGTTNYILDTKTDNKGKYIFTNLDCNNIIDPNGDVDDPNNYVGGVIYSYWVEFATPQDGNKNFVYKATKRNALSNDEVDSDVEEIILNGIGTKRNASHVVTLSVNTLPDGTLKGEDNMSVDAGFIAFGSLGDYVWIDANRNGIQEIDELGVAGVQVRLYKLNANGELGNVIEETKTDVNGYYLFSNLSKGNFVVEFDINNVDSHGYSAYSYTTPFKGVDEEIDSDATPILGDSNIARSNPIAFPEMGYNMSIDAGLIYHSAISGYAFEDRNFSDLQDDIVADIALQKTVVELYRIVDGVREDKPIRNMNVKADGTYFFDDLVEGNYQVKFIYPDGYEAVEAHMGDDRNDSDVSEELNTALTFGYTPRIQLLPNSIQTHWDGGALRYSSIGDYIWQDENKDGVQDVGESPVGNVPVYLFERNQKGAWGYLASTSSNDHGYYFFDRLIASEFTNKEYRVVFGFDPYTKITTSLAGGDRKLDSNALANYVEDWGYPTNVIALGYATSDMTWDAGIIESSGSVGDYVWYDTNHNGIQDEENTGISNIEVMLETNQSDELDEDAWKHVGLTKTNDFGYYRFDDLQAGYYRVKFNTSGYQVTFANIGDDMTLDSDGLIASVNWTISRPFYLESGGFDMTWDLGLYGGENGYHSQSLKDDNSSANTGDIHNLQPFVLSGVSSVLVIGGMFYYKKKKRLK